MKKNIALIVALGCAYAGASSTVNYDLLGRKGSKMNSPMVYKNVDYAKIQKNEQQKVGSSLENRALAKTGYGLKDNTIALEGVYNNHGNVVGWMVGLTYYAVYVHPENGGLRSHNSDVFFWERRCLSRLSYE